MVFLFSQNVLRTCLLLHFLFIFFKYPFHQRRIYFTKGNADERSFTEVNTTGVDLGSMWRHSLPVLYRLVLLMNRIKQNQSEESCISSELRRLKGLYAPLFTLRNRGVHFRLLTPENVGKRAWIWTETRKRKAGRLLTVVRFGRVLRRRMNKLKLQKNPRRSWEGIAAWRPRDQREGGHGESLRSSSAHSRKNTADMCSDREFYSFIHNSCCQAWARMP